MTKALLIASVLLLTAYGQELIQNGQFEDNLTGWTVEYDSADGTWSVATGPDYQPDPDNEINVSKTMKYFARAFQAVDVPTTELEFSFSSRLFASFAGGSGYYAYATVALEYLNSSGDLLGRTMFVNKVGYDSLENTSTQHLMVVTDTIWQDYWTLVTDELASLPGVNPADIARARVVLEAHGNGASG
jgi:hypothetical protein